MTDGKTRFLQEARVWKCGVLDQYVFWLLRMRSRVMVTTCKLETELWLRVNVRATIYFRGDSDDVDSLMKSRNYRAADSAPNTAIPVGVPT